MNAGIVPLGEAARRVLAQALGQAHLLRHEHVGTDHLTCALVFQKTGTAATVLRELGLDQEAVRRTLDVHLRVGRFAPDDDPERPYTAVMRRLLANAGAYARRFGKSEIGDEHLLLALLQNRWSFGSSIFEHHGVTHAAVLGAVERLSNDDPS